MVSVKAMLTAIFLLSIIVAGIGVYIEYPKQAFASKVMGKLAETQGVTPNVTTTLSKISYLEYRITWRNVTTLTKLFEENTGSYRLQVFINGNLIDEISFKLSGKAIENITESVYNATTGKLKYTRELNQTALESRITGRAYDTSIAPGLTLLPPEVLYPLFIFYLPHVTYNQSQGYVELTSAKPVEVNLNNKKTYGLEIELRPTQIGLQFARSTWDQNEYNMTVTLVKDLLVALDITMVNVPQGGAVALEPPHVKLVKIEVKG
ncbi:MAG: hypothetical protein LRS47_02795 [Desulfurococcales archaeon]|nr:hypothetical protein [Desulfurococcales archaeon]